MSVYNNTPGAFERYQRKQAEVAAWARHAPTHQTASAPGWHTPTQPPFSPGRHGHLTPHTFSQQPSSPLSRSLSNRGSWHDERSYGSHASSRHQDIPIPTGFVHQPSSKARTSSESRNWEGQCSMERSRMMDYVPSPLSTTYLPSPAPSRYAAAPAIPSAPITLAPRAGPHRTSTASSYSPVNEWPNGNQFPPGFVPHGPAVASSVPIIRSDSSRSSSAPSVAIVSATPPQAAFLSRAYSGNSSRRAPSRSLSYGPGYTRSPSNSTAAMSYPSSEAQYRHFATSGRRSIMASDAAGREGRHARSRFRSISPASSDKTYDGVTGTRRHHDRVAVSQTDNAWLASQLPVSRGRLLLFLRTAVSEISVNGINAFQRDVRLIRVKLKASPLKRPSKPPLTAVQRGGLGRSGLPTPLNAPSTASQRNCRLNGLSENSDMIINIRQTLFPWWPRQHTSQHKNTRGSSLVFHLRRPSTPTALSESSLSIPGRLWTSMGVRCSIMIRFVGRIWFIAKTISEPRWGSEGWRSLRGVGSLGGRKRSRRHRA